VRGYGVWGITELWVIVHNFPPTDVVELPGYGVSEVMGYSGYGLRGVRLYIDNSMWACEKPPAWELSLFVVARTPHGQAITA
jgi:hypothetical protein